MLLPLLAALPLQQARMPVPIEQATSTGISTAGDLSIFVHRAPEGGPLFVRRSDGRGVVWTDPEVVVDAPTLVQGSGAAVDGQRAIVVWTDDRHDDASLPIAARSVYVRGYDATTGALGPEVLVPSGAPPERTQVLQHLFDAERVGDEVRIHVLMRVEVLPEAGPAERRLVLTTSTDGGASFAAPLAILPVQPVPVLGQTSLAADGDRVVVAWTQGTFGANDIYLQRSSDGGASLDWTEPRHVVTEPGLFSFALDLAGSKLAIVYAFVIPEFAWRGVLGAVSTDGGETFSDWQDFRSEPFAQPQKPTLAFSPDGATLVVGWEDQGEYDFGTGEYGPFETYLKRTQDDGTTWSGPEQISCDGGRELLFGASGPGRDRMFATWRTGAVPMAALSYDAGASFGPCIPLGPGHLAPFQGVAGVYNDAHQNLIALWTSNEPGNPHYLGGVRPQYVQTAGLAAGSTTIGAELARFDDGSPVAFLLVSTALGDLPLPLGDGRALGLGPSGLLTTSIQLALAGPFAAPLGPDGTGALAPIAVPALPGGVTLHLAGVGFDPATLAFGDVSDVTTLTL